MLTSACSFWDIRPRSTGEELYDRLRTIEATLSSIRDMMDEGCTLDIGMNRMFPISVHGVNGCFELNSHLMSQFADDLTYIKNRVDRRGILRSQ